MRPLTEQKTGWIYAWRNCGTVNAPSYSAFFTNQKIGTNIVYSYADLLEVAGDPTIASQIPRDLMHKILDEYPTQDKHADQAVA